MKRPQAKGFTLVELLIVVGIIAILASIALPEYEALRLKSAYAEGMINVRGVATAEDTYYAFYDRYGTLASLGYDTYAAGGLEGTNLRFFSLFGFSPGGNTRIDYAVIGYPINLPVTFSPSLAIIVGWFQKGGSTEIWQSTVGDMGL